MAVKLSDRYTIEDGVIVLRQMRNGKPMPTEREAQEAIDRYHATRMVIDPEWAKAHLANQQMDVWAHSQNLWGDR